jgi:hypothetical protein
MVEIHAVSRFDIQVSSLLYLSTGNVFLQTLEGKEERDIIQM